MDIVSQVQQANYGSCKRALLAVLEVHQPIDALNVNARNHHKVQVCTGCGQDDGNWNRYPCPTVRAIADQMETTQ